eukprot:Filipodium_phascolosomae@DN2429_c0_g1_i10.p1
MEAWVAVLHDTDLFKSMEKWKVMLPWFVCAVATGSVYCTDAGMALVNGTDWYLSHMSLQALAFLKCFILTWIYRNDEVARMTTGNSWVQIVFACFWFGGVALAAGLVVGLKGNAMFYGLAAGLAISLLAVIGIVIYLVIWKSKNGSQYSLPQLCYLIFMGPAEIYRNDVNSICARPDTNKCSKALSINRLSVVWAFAVKYVVCSAGIFLLAIDYKKMIETFANPYWMAPYNTCGIILSFSSYLGFIWGLVWPEMHFFKILYGNVLEQKAEGEALMDDPEALAAYYAKVRAQAQGQGLAQMDLGRRRSSITKELQDVEMGVKTVLSDAPTVVHADLQADIDEKTALTSKIASVPSEALNE